MFYKHPFLVYKLTIHLWHEWIIAECIQDNHPCFKLIFQNILIACMTLLYLEFMGKVCHLIIVFLRKSIYLLDVFVRRLLLKIFCHTW